MGDNLKVVVERPVNNEKTLKTSYELHAPKQNTLMQTMKNKLKKSLKPSKRCVLNSVTKKLPVIDLFRTYKLKYLLKDFISGLTVGIIQIAPTMANATTANLPPINGLYVAFFSVIAYLIFGTSRHLSLGTHGVISLMVANCIKQYDGILYGKVNTEANNHTLLNHTSDLNYLSDNPVEAKIMIAMTLAIFAGSIQLLLGVLNAGFISRYLSDSLVEASTIGSSYLIVVSQVEYLIGIKYKSMKLPFKLANNIIGILSEIKHLNWVTLVMSVVSITILYLVKRFVNDKFRKKLPAPVPIELIVVVVATLIVHFFQFGPKYGVALVGNIPTGIPSPRLPPFGLFGLLFSQSLSIAVVAFALNISTAKFYAKKYHYSLCINQELLAYGVGNVLSGLFSGMPATGGLTRTRIVETSGAKTQVFSLVSSMCVLVVILGVGFLLKDLPYCVLASIIVAALLKNCFEVKQLYELSKKSKFEALIWFCTFAGVVILDIDYGLYIGLAVSLISVIIRNQLAPVSILGRIPGTDIFEPIDICSNVEELRDLKIVRYEDSVYFANAEIFYNQVLKSTDVNAREILKKMRALDQNTKSSTGSKATKKNTIRDTNEHDREQQLALERMEILSKTGLKHLILDFSCVNFIDLMGVERLIELLETLRILKIEVHITHLKYSVMHAINMYKESKTFDFERVYPTNQDAIFSIRLNDDFTKDYKSMQSFAISNSKY